MATSFHQWESDPLFAAAEVVQDSADRMESLFRLLLHEQSLVQGDNHDPRLLTSIEYHKRDLTTILETAKWQLEDFERAVSSSAAVDKCQGKEDVISRHRQFVGAIRTQINHVEKSVDGSSMGNSTRNSEWVNLNDQDRDLLALFLMGGNTTEHVNHYEKEGCNILRRYLDPTSASSLEDNEIVEYDSGEVEKVKINGDVHADHYHNLVNEDNLVKMGSDYSRKLYTDEINTPQDMSHDRCGDDSHWDLEANEATPKSFFHENRLRGFYSRINFFRLLNDLWITSWNRSTRNYTKRLKDGEEQRRSPTYIDVSHSELGQHGRLRLGSECRNFQQLYFRIQAKVMHLGSCLGARYQRFPFHIQVTRHSMQIILTTIFMLIFLGVMVSRIA